MKTVVGRLLIASAISVMPAVVAAQSRSTPHITDSTPPAPAAVAPCDASCSNSCCAAWSHCTTLFGEFIYLRPSDVEVAYGVPTDGGIPPAPPIQIGPVGVVDFEHEPGFRVGGSFALDSETSIVATFTALESHTSDSMSVTAPTAINALILHPSTNNAADSFLDASADYSVDFDTVDLDYRRLLACGDRYALNYITGVRYARIDQDFSSRFTNVATVESVVTDVNFDGGGPRFGLDYERHGRNSGFMSYGRLGASFVAGEFGARYQQTSTADPNIVDTSWEANRLLSILDLEIGSGWQSRDGLFRFTVGYMISAWFNTVQTDEWIQAVQTNSFVGLNDRMSFDGYTFRGEMRF